LQGQDQTSANDLPFFTAELVASYVAKNAVHMSELPGLISSVHAALSNLGQPKEAEPEKLIPPVSIKKSVTPDYLAGKGLTPAAYRQKWGLPSDYPMTAPTYSAQRSQLARTLGLGRKKEEAPPPPAKGRTRKKAAAPAETA
jgi:predicted transcriptional regulator